ncbi:MAG: FMN-binding protein [Clostridiales bacterium]|jgi:uncharacterized protein with FMN-binding domain|nr:FMN-binding protein [Clostridiales bacterium]
MKRRTKFIGVALLAAFTLLLAACVYEGDGGAVAPVTPTPPTGEAVFTNVTAGEQVFTISVPPAAARSDHAPQTVAGGFTAFTGPESVAAVADATAWSNDGDSLENVAPLVLEVTFTPNSIANIRVVSHAETVGQTMGTNGGVSYLQMVYPALTDQVIFHQSTLAIDAFTHATVTRNAFLRGINEAIVEAGADPTALAPMNLNATQPPAGARFIPGVAHIYVPAGQFVVADRNAAVLDILELTPAVATQLGLVNAEGGPVNASIEQHGVLHNGMRRQATPAIDARLGLAAERAQVSPDSDYFAHYIHAPVFEPTSTNPLHCRSMALMMGMNETFGLNLSYGDANPFAGEPVGLALKVSFGFNSFWINERGASHNSADFTGLVLGAHGETMRGGFGSPANIATYMQGGERFTHANITALTPLAVNSNALGDYWGIARPVLNQINDRQSTHNIDAFGNSTMTAVGIRVAVQQLMERQGANVAQITPIDEPLFRTPRARGASTGNPGGGNADGTILRPSRTDFQVSGVTFSVVMDREVIRQFRTIGDTAGIAGWDGNNWAEFRNNVLFVLAGAAGEGGFVARFAEVPLMAGIDAAVAQQILDGVVAAFNANNVGGEINNVNRIGYSYNSTGRDRLPAPPRINR